MQEETADELLGRNRHHAGPLGMAIVFPLKRDLAIGKREQPLVANRDPVGVAAEIVDHLLRSAKGRLGIDHPLFVAQRLEVSAKRFRLTQGLLLAEELELTVNKELDKGVKQAVAKPGREHANGQEEVRTAARDPTVVIRTETAAGNEVVNVRVEQKILTPAMKDPEIPGLGAQIPAVAADGGKYVHADSEQQIVEQASIVKDQRVEFGGNREDHVEVGDGQHLSLPLLEPAGARQRTTFRAMPIAAGIVADEVFAAMAALIDMAAERGGPADLDGAHHPQGRTRESMGAPVGLAMLSKNVGHFQGGAGHGYTAGGECFLGRPRFFAGRAGGTGVAANKVSKGGVVFTSRAGVTVAYRAVVSIWRCPSKT